MGKIWTEYKKRERLRDILPLETPLAIQVEPANACNFRCAYCIHSSDKKAGIISNKLMSLELYENFIGGGGEISSKTKNHHFMWAW